MKRRKFKLSHSLLGTAALIVAESLLIFTHTPVAVAEGVILAASIAGIIVTIFVATEAVEEVKGSMNMFMILSLVILEFLVFFAFQYWFLCLAQPASFPDLSLDPISLMLTSVLVFVFNPINLPATIAGRGLLLIEIIGSLGLVMFVLQNVSQFRRKSLDTE